ncbi:MAG: SEC-C domain-containing protein [Pseudonocardiaceae bacterium]
MAERRAREVAAVLGVADFVYAQPLVRKGSATREVGDGLLICGGRGAVVQVKARDRDAGRRDSPEKAERVVGKFLDAAVRQGRGTKRTIGQYARQAQPLRVLPVRALGYPQERRDEFALTLAEDCADWPIIVVIDHPNDPIVEVNPDADVFCVSLDDWHELNGHIRSVNGVLRYVQRVLDHGAALAVPFGEERRRFAKLVEADAASTVGSTTAVPWLSYDGVDDPVAVAVYRELLEKVWDGEARGPALTADECRRILDVLDDVPVATQTRVGRWILDKRRILQQTGQRASGCIAVGGDDGHSVLVYMCDTEANEANREHWVAELGTLTLVRAAEWREQRAEGPRVVGIGVRETDGGVEYSHIYSSGLVAVPGDVRRMIEWRYGISDFRTGRNRTLQLGRNEQCPCGSGRKVKQCHGAPGRD